MHRGLHGRGALFDTDPPGLASRLVGLRPYQLRSNPYEHPKELPFVVFAGGRGLGKSAVLRELRDAYRGHTPVALIDGEERQFAGPPAERPAESWSPVGQALTTIAEQLAEPVTGAGRIGFPRLTSGLLAVAASGWSDRDVPRIRQEAERILLLNETGSWLSGFAGRWVSKVVSKLIASLSGTGPVIAPIIEATLEAFAEGIGPAPRRLRRAATWYRDYPNAGGNPKLGLILLSSHFRAGGDSRTHAERYLVRALLADLDDAYAGVMQRSHRLGRPVVLIDNVQERAGLGLLEPVLRDRADGIADHVVFFAALRGYTHGALRNASRRTLPEVARHTGWEPGTSPSSRALLVALPPLTPDDTLHLVGGVSQGLAVPPQLPYATHRLSGGSPLGVTLLADSARQNLPQGAKSLGELLTSDVAVHEDNDGRPTYQELLDRLVPGGRLDELTVLAAAHDRDSACVLAEVQLSDDFGASGVLALEERLAEEGWPSAAGQFVGDPFLRALLLLRLHHDDPDHARWQSVHRALIDHYGDGDQPDGARYRLHHELALGKADFAVAHLRDTFPRTDTASWLSSLVFIASAPYYHAHDPDGRDFGGHGGHDDRAAVALGRTDAAQQPPDSVDAVLHLRVRRLLHAVWQLTDPLVLPDPKVSDRLRFELEQLSNLRPAGNPLLWRASREWPSDALAGHPLRVPGDDDDNVNGDL
ncbi:hypothetical protein FNV62_29960 [Streptomyces sp. RLB3-17]|uniref:hypothetical protein n=1 Tax=unclassified Streptomyces TaxID=2593676 RepID=UPI0011646C78|nr:MULTISPECIES: hypothetical protein [unclassified Streptomyces]QDO00015.1 hypothetical protein FNV58_32220 [Streptomyces sp. RLB1-9]QDO21744.1 hypothetical protein FNV65_30790 [Streptomyces sp. S1A1-8]QDO31869.1 hypothetical protein FNV63_30810 [Streptomyces sp. S1A1-3]QDO41787.1 hypothetical protein FNV62_29960 [Streptomyces sp. RLB3-17]